MSWNGHLYAWCRFNLNDLHEGLKTSSTAPNTPVPGGIGVFLYAEGSRQIPENPYSDYAIIRTNPGRHTPNFDPAKRSV